jgi:PGF-CTERM protein
MIDRTSVLPGILAVLVVTVAAGPAIGAAAATPHDSTEPAFVVDLDTEGDATVTLRLTYDLTDDEEKAAFEDLKNDEAARTDYRERYVSRLADVAANAENETGREMAVSDGAVELSTADDTGIVELSAEWTGLAAVTDGELVLTEPFASGFQPDHQFVVVAPDGYGLASSAVEPATTTDGAVVWDAGTDLSGFEVTFAESADTTHVAASPGEPEDSAPGFGPVLALVALLAAALVAARRQ